MAQKYLDSTGLSYLWGKLKDYFQVKLVSGTNIKTVNGTSLLGSGNVPVGVTGVKGNSEYSYRAGNVNLTAANVGIADFVTEQGTSSSWYYRKWNSGKIEAWTKYDAGNQTPAQWVTGWYYKDIVVAIPSGIFSATPTHVLATNSGSDYQFSVFAAVPVSTTSIRVRAVKPNSGAARPIFSIYVSNMV